MTARSLDGRVSQEIWYHQVAYARTVAAWEAAHGDQVGALARLQAVKQSYARYNRDALVQLVDLEVDRDRAIYATDIGDARTLQTAAVSVGEVRSAQTVPWALTATDRTSLLIEGLRQVARQRPADAARVLEQLEAAGATSGETEPLRTRL